MTKIQKIEPPKMRSTNRHFAVTNPYAANKPVPQSRRQR
jgi:hypothetical protein